MSGQARLCAQLVETAQELERVARDYEDDALAYPARPLSAELDRVRLRALAYRVIYALQDDEALNAAS